MGQPIEGSNPSLSATSPVGLGPGRRSLARRLKARGRFYGRLPAGCYDSGAVLGGELAVPCTCNPLQQG